LTAPERGQRRLVNLDEGTKHLHGVEVIGIDREEWVVAAPFLGGEDRIRRTLRFALHDERQPGARGQGLFLVMPANHLVVRRDDQSDLADPGVRKCTEHVIQKRAGPDRHHRLQAGIGGLPLGFGEDG
jgi:hypothetical protein